MMEFVTKEIKTGSKYHFFFYWNQIVSIKSLIVLIKSIFQNSFPFFKTEIIQMSNVLVVQTLKRATPPLKRTVRCARSESYHSHKTNRAVHKANRTIHKSNRTVHKSNFTVQNTNRTVHQTYQPNRATGVVARFRVCINELKLFLSCVAFILSLTHLKKKLEKTYLFDKQQNFFIIVFYWIHFHKDAVALRIIYTYVRFRTELMRNYKCVCSS